MAGADADTVETGLASKLSELCLNKVKASHGNRACADESVYLLSSKPITHDFHEQVTVVTDAPPKSYTRSKAPRAVSRKGPFASLTRWSCVAA